MYKINLKQTNTTEQGVTTLIDEPNEAMLTFNFICDAKYMHDTDATLINGDTVIETKQIKAITL